MRRQFIILIVIILTPFQIKAGTGDAIFESNKIHVVDISLMQCNAMDSLMHYKNSAKERIPYMQGNVRVNNENFYAVGIRYKGESSFDYYPGVKKSIKIKFNKYIKGQNLDGLTTINLNNAFKDPAFMRDKIFCDFLRYAGINAPRCTYAWVRVNGQELGLYVLIEQINKSFLRTVFKKNFKGNMYKGHPKPTFEYVGTDTTLYMRRYRDEQIVEKPYADLIHLIQVINNKELSEQEYFDELGKKINLETMFKVWAVNNMLVNIDCYNIWWPHNFYLFRHPESRKFEWIPYDGNYLFCAWSPFLNYDEAVRLSYKFINDSVSKRHVLHSAIWDNPILFGKYKDIYKALFENYYDFEWFEHKIDSLAYQLRPYVYRDQHKMYSNDEFEKNINETIGETGYAGGFIPGLKPFIKERRKFLKKELKK